MAYVFEAKNPKFDADYTRECEDLLEPSFKSFVENIEILGWDGDVVAEALMSLAEKHRNKRQSVSKSDPIDISLSEMRIKYGSVQ